MIRSFEGFLLLLLFMLLAALLFACGQTEEVPTKTMNGRMDCVDTCLPNKVQLFMPTDFTLTLCSCLDRQTTTFALDDSLPPDKCVASCAKHEGVELYSILNGLCVCERWWHRKPSSAIGVGAGRCMKSRRWKSTASSTRWWPVISVRASSTLWPNWS